MKHYKLINLEIFKVLDIYLPDDIDSVDYINNILKYFNVDNKETFEKDKVYDIVYTEYPLPKPLPQKIAINEMETNDIIKQTDLIYLEKM